MELTPSTGEGRALWTKPSIVGDGDSGPEKLISRCTSHYTHTYIHANGRLRREVYSMTVYNIVTFVFFYVVFLTLEKILI